MADNKTYGDSTLTYGSASYRYNGYLELDYMEYSSDALAQAAYVSNGLTGVADQSQTSSNTYEDLGDRNNNEMGVGQSFQVQAKKTITGIQLKRHSISGSPTGNWVIRIETDNAGVPSGTLVNANATTTGTPISSDGETKDFNFAVPFPVEADTTYWIVVSCDAQATNVRWDLDVTNTNPYALGVCFYKLGSTVTLVAGEDMHFIVYTQPLQSYSESTIKTQGSYSLKAVAAATDSLNKTLTRTIVSPLDLSGINTISFDIRSSRTGSNIKVGIHDSGGTTTEITPSIISADSFQTVVWDVSSVSDANKDAIDSIIVTTVNADVANTFYIDNMYGDTALASLIKKVSGVVQASVLKISGVAIASIKKLLGVSNVP
jgi:hypothetical protein